MDSRTDSEDLRNCLTHERFRLKAAEPAEPAEPANTSDTPNTSEDLEQPLDLSPESYMGIVTKSSLSHQAAAIRRLQERRKKFSNFMPK